MALLAKLLWWMVQHRGSLSSRVLIAKYGGWKAIVMGSQPSNCSYIWRSMIWAVLEFQEALVWDVLDGVSVMFWLDTRLGNEPLIPLVTSPLPKAHSNRTVKQYWQPVGGWNPEEIQNGDSKIDESGYNFWGIGWRI